MKNTDRIDGWLMVIDMQSAFSRPESRWYIDSYDRARQAVLRLIPLFEDRIVYTRFIPPEREAGSWAAYYDRWSEFARANSPLPGEGRDSVWDIDLGDVQIEHVLDASTFSKWVPEQLPAGLLESGEVYLCGVSFECCVLGTALAAIDHGADVHIIADGVGASSAQMMDATLALLHDRSPQLTITELSELRGLRAG